MEFKKSVVAASILMAAGVNTTFATSSPDGTAIYPNYPAYFSTTTPAAITASSPTTTTPTPLENIYVQLGGGITHQMATNWKSSFGSDGGGARSVAPDDNVSVSYLGSVGLGYALTNYPIRFDLTYYYFGETNYNWMDWTTTGGDVQPAFAKIKAQAGLLSVSYDFYNQSLWTPFITAGAGFAGISNQITWTDPNAYNYLQDHMSSQWHSQNNFVFHSGLGVYYYLSRNWSVGALADYMNFGSIRTYFMPGTSATPSPDAQTFNAVKLYNISVMGSLVWRPAGPENTRYTTLDTSPTYSTEVTMSDRVYFQAAGGPSVQFSNNWQAVNGVPSIRSPNSSALDNIQGAAALGYVLPERPIRLDVSYNYFTQTNADWPYLYQQPQTASQSSEPANYKFAHAKINSQAALFDVTYDFVNSSRWIPFITILVFNFAGFTRTYLGTIRQERILPAQS